MTSIPDINIKQSPLARSHETRPRKFRAFGVWQKNLRHRRKCLFVLIKQGSTGTWNRYVGRRSGPLRARHKQRQAGLLYGGCRDGLELITRLWWFRRLSVPRGPPPAPPPPGTRFTFSGFEPLKPLRFQAAATAWESELPTPIIKQFVWDGINCTRIFKCLGLSWDRRLFENEQLSSYFTFPVHHIVSLLEKRCFSSGLLVIMFCWWHRPLHRGSRSDLPLLNAAMATLSANDDLIID